MNKEKIEQVQAEIEKMGYTRNSIEDYTEMKSLHQKYGKEMPEAIFIIEILEVPYPTYQKLANGTQKRARILSGKEVIPIRNMDEDEKKQRIFELKKQLETLGYGRRYIEYDVFQSLYQAFGRGTSEREFAIKVLEANSSNYQKLIERKVESILILRNHRRIITEVEKRRVMEENERIQAIQQKLIRQGYGGKNTEYEEIKELYQIHGQGMSEERFVRKALKGRRSDYQAVKTGKNKTIVILTGVEKIFTGEEIQQEQKVRGTLTDQEEMREWTAEEINELQQKLQSLGYGKSRVQYQVVQELYQEYGIEMSERDFAIKVLQIEPTIYRKLVRGEQKTVGILRGFLHILTEKEKKEKNWERQERRLINRSKKKLIALGYGQEELEYSGIQALHQEFGQWMPEERFAREVLEITNYFYQKLLSGERTTVPILKKYRKSILESQQQEEQLVEEKNIVRTKRTNTVQKNMELAKQCVQEIRKQITEGVSPNEALQLTAEMLGIEPKRVASLLRNYLLVINQDKDPEVEELKVVYGDEYGDGQPGGEER